MAAHQFWRLTGFSVAGNGPLELSEARLYASGALADDAAALSCTIAPESGALADLRDGLATGVVSWPHAAHSSPGFALVWDLGGAPADVDSIRLGAGSSLGTFPRDLTLQGSDDAEFWTTSRSAREVTFPGMNALTAMPEAIDVDPYASLVSLMLPLADAPGTGFTDIGPTPKAISNINGVASSSAIALFDRPTAVFDGSGYLTSPADSGFSLGSGDFTIEAWVFPSNAAAGVYFGPNRYQSVVGQQQVGSPLNSTCWLNLMDLRPSGGLFQNQSTNPGAITADAALPLNEWAFLEYTRVGSTCYLWVNGALAGTAAMSGATDTSTRPLAIGADSTGNCKFQGRLGGVRITKGAGRHTSAYSPPASRFDVSTYIFLPVDAAARRLRAAPAHTYHWAGAVLPAGAVSSHLTPVPFFDAYHGGLGIIYGSVEAQHTPSNTLLRRRVLLIDEASRLTIRETWSDAVTGAYEFRGIKAGVKYSVLSYDHTHALGAVVGDNITPEVMP